MADVDMTDAPPVAKKKGGDIEGKKRFEVKKVRRAYTRYCKLFGQTGGR